MKLIRLVSSDKGGLAIFDNNFNAIINIKPKSKIALDTCVLDITPKLIKIKNGINDEVRYQVSIQGAEQGSIRGLSRLTYNASNIDLFLEDIENKLNANLEYILPAGGYQEKAIGLEWFVERSSASNDGKLVIGYNIVPFQDYLSDVFTTDFTGINDFWFCGSTEETFLEKTAIVGSSYLSISKKATAPANDTYKLKSLIDWCRGGASFRVGKILSTTNGGDITKNGFMMHIEDSQGNFIYGIRMNRIGTVYQTTLDGINFTSLQDLNGDDVLVDNAGGATDTNSDAIEIIVDTQDIYSIVYRDGKDDVQTDSFRNVNYGESYNAVISITGAKTNCSISHINYTISLKDLASNDRAGYKSGDENDPTDNNYLETHPRLTNTTPPHPIFKPTANNFYLPQDVMRFLGFSQIRFPLAGSSMVDYPRYVAESPLELGALSDNFIVQLNNLQLKSYDGDTLQDNGQRRSILSLIPDDDSDNQTLYNANERLFLDIDNIEPLNLNRLSISILDDNYDIIKLKNKSSLSVIIKDENE